MGQALAAIFAATVIALGGYLWRSRKRVVAEVVHGPTRMPEAVLRRLDPRRSTTREEYYLAMAGGGELPDEQARWINSGAERLVARERAQRRADEPYLGIAGVSVITVINKRPKPAIDVSLRLPSGTVVMRVEREDGAKEELGGGSRLPLGTLQPGERVTVTTWLSSSVTSLFVAEIRVSDTEGEGVVRVKALVGPTWGWLAENWWVLLLAGGFLLGFVIGEVKPKPTPAPAPQSSPPAVQPSPSARD